MKKIIFAIYFILSAVVGYAQTISWVSLRNEKFSDNSYSIVIEDSLQNSQKFINAKQWVAKTFNDYKGAIQFEDKDNGKIVIKGIMPVEQFRGEDIKEIYNVNIDFTLTIDIKPEKYRLKFENMKAYVKKKVDFGLMAHNSEKEMSLDDFLSWDSGAKMNSTSFYRSFAGLLNSAITAINTNDDF